MEKLYDSTYLEQLQTFFARTKKRSFDLLQPQEHEVIVDVGCGTGTDALNLFQQSNANIIGIDHDCSFITKAKKRIEGKKIEFICCEAEQIPLPSQSIDKVRFDRVFQHIPNQKDVLAETSRILKPGGIIQIIDTNYLGFKLFMKDEKLEEKLINLIAYDRIPSGHSISSLQETLTINNFSVEKNEVHNYLIEDSGFANYIIRFDKIVKEEFEKGKISNNELLKWKEHRPNFNFSLDLVLFQARKIEG